LKAINDFQIFIALLGILNNMKKIILITGANRGIGFETARQLGKIGHQIILSARNKTKLDQSVTKLKEENIEVKGLLMDISNDESVRNASVEFAKHNIKLDVLINNAAILLFANDKSLITDDLDLYNTTINNNSTGLLRVIRAFLPFISSPGRIINLSSGGGSLTETIGAGFAPAYCVSKTLINGLTKQLSFELSSRNISINSVCPGWVRTDMGGSNAERSVEKGAETPVWLATDAPKDFTGMFFRDKKQIAW
jgi:NAD(P)-dependent dehydrogenase (short-subunit alcohol dehydrogenase family)